MSSITITKLVKIASKYYSKLMLFIFFFWFFPASESVSKLFRHSSKHRSPTATDTVSLTSTATSDSKRLESDIEVIDVSSPDTSKTLPTPSTARLDEFDNTEVLYNKAKDFESYKEFTMENTPLKRSISK